MTQRPVDASVPTDYPPLEAELDTTQLVAGRYEIRTRLGEGAMGSVYAAFDHELEEEIALKVLHPAIAATEGALDRFRREVKLARRVTHANVARTYDFGSTGDVRFITMELLVGKALSDRMVKPGVGLADALRIASDIAQGLAAAHLAGVVHRDLKPDNVLIDISGAGPDGGERTVITDFGIAVLAANGKSGVRQTMTVAGTPAYMAPEQLEGKELDGRADVYALGVILYELLTRKLPFFDEAPYALAIKRLTQDPPDVREYVPDLPAPIARLVMDMLARSRDVRPDTQAVIERLDVLRGAGRTRAGGGRAFDTSLGQSVPRPLPTPTLVVLPRSEDPSVPSPGAAFAESVADALAAEKGVRTIAPMVVRARLAGMMGAGKPWSPDALLSELRASHLLEVNLEADAAGHSRGRARVVDASLALLASHTAEGHDAEGVAIALAACVAQAFESARPVDSGAVSSTSRGPISTGAVDARAAGLYQEAMTELARFGLDHTSRAIEMLHRAEEVAPSDPFIASALGAALVKQWSFVSDRALLGQAEEYSLRALAANSQIGETFNTIGILRLHQGELRAAVRAFEEAAARSPRLAEPYSYLGRLLSESGKLREAETRLTQAMRLDPLDFQAASELSRIAALNGDWDKADELLEQVLERTGQRIVIATQARYALWRGDLERLEKLVHAIEEGNDAAFHLVKRVFVPIWRAFVANDSIAPNDPRLGALRSTAAGTSMRMTTFWHQMLAEIYAKLGQTSAAVDSIERSVGRALVDVFWLDRCVLLDGVRSDVRFVRARTATASRAASLWR